MAVTHPYVILASSLEKARELVRISTHVFNTDEEIDSRKKAV
jgi:selenocysteine lyase/cysteine desulfurase